MSSKPDPPPILVVTAEPTTASAKHFHLDLKFPIYALDFIDEFTVVLGGGGGSSKSGIKNRLSMYRIDIPTRTFHLLTEHGLSREEDAPMTIVINPATKELITGINSSAAQMKEGINENCRVFSYGPDSIKFERSQQTIQSRSEDHYQKVTARTRSTASTSLVAIGSTDSQLSLLNYPKLDLVFPNVDYEEGDELYDVDFNDSGEWVMGTSSKKLCIWSTSKPRVGDLHEPLQIIQRPALRPELSCTFRASKFGRKETANNLYTMVNTTPAVRSKKAGRGEKKSFISLWDLKTWKLTKTRTVSERPLTAFDISDDGTLLAFGSSDLSVGVLDAKTLHSIMTILRAHDFPVTSLRFNPTSTLLLSGSADNSVRVITIPPVDKRAGSSALTNIAIALFMLILAILIQSRMSDELLLAGRSMLPF